MTHTPDDRPDRRNDRSASVVAGDTSPHASSDTPGTTADRTDVSLAAITVWLLIQLTVLSLSAARVPLWYRTPDPVERVAIHQMLAAQLATAAVLFPWLMPNLPTGVCIILIMAPFVQLSAMLSGTPLPRVAMAWAYAALWMGALMFISLALKHRRGQLTGVALAGAVVIGIPLIRYLHLEFLHFPPPRMDAGWFIDPISAALSQLSDRPMDASKWVWVALVLAASALSRLWSKRRTEATSYPQV